MFLTTDSFLKIFILIFIVVAIISLTTFIPFSLHRRKIKKAYKSLGYGMTKSQVRSLFGSVKCKSGINSDVFYAGHMIGEKIRVTVYYTNDKATNWEMNNRYYE